MTEILEILAKIKDSDEYGNLARLTTVVMNKISSLKKTLIPGDVSALGDFAFAEMKRMNTVIPKTAEYKLKDDMTAYLNNLMNFAAFVTEYRKLKNLPADPVRAELFKTSEEVLKEAASLEIAIDDFFGRDNIHPDDAEKILKLIKSQPGEYLRGKLFSALAHYKEQIKVFSPEAKALFTIYINTEMSKYLQKIDALTVDESNILEIAADVCRHFADDNTKELLKTILNTNRNNIRYYAIESLIYLGEKKSVSAAAACEIAADLEYAELLFGLLKRSGMTELFPKEFASKEYLAKSNMVHWLVYPTELGKVPDEIELLGIVKKKGEEYYIFKFKTDSDNLLDGDKGVWLVGWSNDEGGTFSHFDKLSGFEHVKLKKTLNNIKKTL